LASVLAPSRVQLVGGEPLLHPDLAAVARAVRDSGISPHVRVISNATVLQRITDRLLDVIDDLHLSVYPGFDPSPDDVHDIAQRCVARNVEMQIKYFDYFREPFALIGIQDHGLVRRIYTACKMAHAWHCHTVEEGYFYKCPQSLFLSVTGHGANADDATQRVSIDGRASLGNEIRQFLESSEPLLSCARCLGSVGRLYKHEQQKRAEWLTPQRRPSADLVDFAYLTALEEENDQYDNLCVRQDWDLPANAPMAAYYVELNIGGRH
jgi:cyclic pyranopterin phosphate synthase